MQETGFIANYILGEKKKSYFFGPHTQQVNSEFSDMDVLLEESSFSTQGDFKSHELVWFTVSRTFLRKEANQLCLRNEPLGDGTEVLIPVGCH